LLGRLLRLFPESVPLEDLFTEAVVHFFETKPELCIAWLEEAGLIAPHAEEPDRRFVRVASQRTFAALNHHPTDSRPDILIEVYAPIEGEPAEDGGRAEAVMIESKIGSKEGQEQLRRYAEHLDGMARFGNKMLVYVTRSYDPKDSSEVLSGLSERVGFEQLRWHDFYRFLRTVEKDALVEEVMTFMEEQGMARSYRFSTTDLVALSGVPRAFEIFDETLGGEVRTELEDFAGNKVRREVHSMNQLRYNSRYVTLASLHDWDLFCFAGYEMEDSEDYPAAIVTLEARPGAVGREASVAAMRRMSLRDGWKNYDLEDPVGWAGVYRWMSLADLLAEEDHVAAAKRFFIESIRQLREELTAFKKEHPDLPWTGGEVPPEER
jgi:hypothetical protein